MAFSYDELPMFVIAFVAGAAFLLYYFISKRVHEGTLEDLAQERLIRERERRLIKNARRRSVLQPFANKLNSPKKRGPYKTYKDGKKTFEHDWLLTTLKGHTAVILDMEFSPNGKYLATCGEDRIILIWYTKDWLGKVHQNVRINVKYDYASMIRWSPDSKAFIIKRQKDNIVEAYKVNKAKGVIRNVAPVITYPRFHGDEIIGLGLSANGKYIMTSSNKTSIVITDLKGTILTRLNSYAVVNYSAHLSPCGQLIVASGFVPHARVWHIKFTEEGEFSGCAKLFDLKGHDSGICDTSFDGFSSKIGTLSKDGTWKLFDINGVGVDKKAPELLVTGTYEQEESSLIALSPLGDVVAIASGSSLSLYNAKSAKLDIIISEIFSGNITRVLFDSEGKYVLVSGDRHIRIFHNITGIKAGAEEAKAKLKQPNNTSALNERLRQQISTAEAFLSSYAS